MEKKQAEETINNNKIEYDNNETKKAEVKEETKEIEVKEETKETEIKEETEEKKEVQVKKDDKNEALKNEALKSEALKNEDTKSEDPKSENEKAGEVKPMETENRKGKSKKILIGIIIGIVIVAAFAYLGVTLFYRNHFFPNTLIDGISCDNMNVETVVPLIDAQIYKYELTVTGRNYKTGKSGEVLGRIDANDIELSFQDTKGAVETVMDSQNEFLWPMVYLQKIKHSYSLSQGIVFNEDKLKKTVESWESCIEENMIHPEDAYISEYIEEKKGYEVIPETVGTELNVVKVLENIEVKLHAHETTIDLEDTGCYTEANVKHDDEKLNSAVETANSWLKTNIVYDWNGNEVILDADTIKEWIQVQPEEVTLDEEAVSRFVKEQAYKFDTYGKSKYFKTTLGIEMKLNSPNYGWKTDTETETEELIQMIYQGSQVKKEPVYSIKAKNKGINDVGNSYIEADLTHQHLYVYQNGEIVFETDVVSGKMNSTPGSVTPAGIFGLTYKTTNAVLRGSDYETPVSYWMPFYGNYGMHDATWRVNFGGTIYQEHGSHGCINLPLDSAATIYNYVSTGFPIVCYYYEVDPLEAQTPTETLTEEELLRQQEPTLSGRAEQAQNQER